MFTAYDDSSSSSSEDEVGTTTPLPKRASTSRCTRPPSLPPPPPRIVMHLDVDAFYCQCEELRDNSLATKPFAVGQKHIIVTCNYVARRVGVTKLMLRTTAKKVCPDLIIIEGSDLQPYRRNSRKIYNAFRKAVARLPGGTKNLARKGGMDEMFADITVAVDSTAGTVTADSGDLGGGSGGGGGSNCKVDVYIYGDDPSAQVSISEDQSGATAVASTRVDASHMSKDEQNVERSRLQIAAMFAATIRTAVKDDTGFTACVGVSTSPMLAKLASELRKPNSLNLLYSWRSSSIVNVMPLRKVPGLGSRTLRSLTHLLEKHNGANLGAYWTCQDLLRIPRDEIAAMCGSGQAELFCARCRGIDPVRLEDDDGALSKTVSVEDSYKRGSLITMDGIQKALCVLYQRLPALLDDRRLDSDRPDLAYPSTIRFSARVVDEVVEHKRRQFVTSSKQCKFDGRSLMLSGETNRVDILRSVVDPLMKELLHDNGNLDVTKLNIAVTGFADTCTFVGGISGTEGQQKSVTAFFAEASGSAQKKSSVSFGGRACTGAKRKAPSLQNIMFRANNKSESSPGARGSPKKRADAPIEQHPSIIDPSFLAALPPDLQAEVLASNQLQNAERLGQSAEIKQKTKGASNGRIDDFFRKY
jgi:DNA polymerase iota